MIQKYCESIVWYELLQESEEKDSEYSKSKKNAEFCGIQFFFHETFKNCKLKNENTLILIMLTRFW